MIIQQTPFCNLWNTFRLCTSLSLNDVKTQGATIGFFPDVSTSVAFANAASTAGVGTSNNSTAGSFPTTTGAFNPFTSYNAGFVQRTQAWNFDPAGQTAGLAAGGNTNGVTYGSLMGNQAGLSNSACNQLWKSYIFNKVKILFLII